MVPSAIRHFLDHLRRSAPPRDGAEQTDGELLEAFVGHRDARALEALVRRHALMVWGVCRRTLTYHDAQDAFQATFLVLVRRAASIRTRELLANWLYGVAHKTACKARQRAAIRATREPQMSTTPEPQAVESRDCGFGPEQREMLDEELNRLPEKYRTAIVLCDLEGQTRTEVARKVRAKEGTVASRLARGRALLARRLRRRGIALPAAALAAVFSSETGTAAVPVSLLTSTLSLAQTKGGIKAGAVAAETARALLLAEGVLRTMMLARLKTLAVVLFIVGLGTLGGGLLVQSLWQAPPLISDEAASQQTDPGKDRPTKGQELMLLEGHTGPVLAVAISPDGKVLASAGADGLRTWALPGGKPLTTPATDAAPVNGLAFSPDGKLLALACGNGVVKLWDVAAKQEKGDLKGHTGAVLTVAFHPDGGRLASGGADGAIKLWTVNGNGDPITCKNPGWMRGPVRVVTFSQEDESHLHPMLRGRLTRMLAAAGGADKGRAGWMGLWNGQTGEVLSGSPATRTRGGLETATGEGDTRGSAVAFNPNGEVLAFGGKAAAVSVCGRIPWGIQRVGVVRQYGEGHGEGVYAIAFSRDGRRVISAGADGLLKVWEIPDIWVTYPESGIAGAMKDISMDNLRIIRRGHTGPIRCLAASADGALLATGGDDHTVRVWTLPAPLPPPPSPPPPPGPDRETRKTAGPG
jgi:RNA polymerase sigma factor (sigma-70 family)